MQSHLREMVPGPPRGACLYVAHVAASERTVQGSAAAAAALDTEASLRGAENEHTPRSTFSKLHSIGFFTRREEQPH